MINREKINAAVAQINEIFVFFVRLLNTWLVIRDQIKWSEIPAFLLIVAHSEE